jgi:putative hydrolase of the HAD superfamily
LTVSEEVGVKKPNPEIFLFALNKAHAKIEESLMIGDEMAVDIDGARSIGMDQVLFNPKSDKVEGKHTYEVHDLLEINKLL